MQPSLKQEAMDAGVDFNRLISLIEKDLSGEQMAEELGVSEKTALHLREQFFKKGVASIMGQD